MDTEKTCNTCRQAKVNLRRCTGCLYVNYCSKECQIRDWMDGHKHNCKEFRMSSTNSGKHMKNTMGKGLDFADSSESLRQPSEGHPVCTVCGSSTNVRTCSRCKVVKYCSKQCQKTDWPKHKKGCNQVTTNLNKANSSEHRKQLHEETESVFRTRNRNLEHFHSSPDPFSCADPHNILGSNLPGARSDVPRLPSSLGNATAKARILYPMRNIIDKFEELPEEHSAMRPEGTGHVLLAYMCRYHPHQHRYGMYLKDKDEDETYVVFYFEWDDPPFFSWTDIKPGRYICVENAFMHQFLNRKRGIRVDNVSDVKIFDA